MVKELNRETKKVDINHMARNFKKATLEEQHEEWEEEIGNN